MSEEANPMVLQRNETAWSMSWSKAIAPVGVIFAGAVALAACSPVPDLPPAPMEPEASSYTANLPPYRIQVGDVLEVRLLLNPELNEEVTVRPDGHISTTAVPDALAYGRTPADLAACRTPRVYSVCARRNPPPPKPRSLRMPTRLITTSWPRKRSLI